MDSMLWVQEISHSDKVRFVPLRQSSHQLFYTNCSFIFVEISSLLAVESIHQLSICPHRLGGADINVLKSMVEAGHLGE